MEHKSQNIQQSAFEVRQQARKIEIEARKRRCRIYAMIGCIVLVVLLIIIFMISGAVDDDDSGPDDSNTDDD